MSIACSHDLAPTGITGLDSILLGGLPRSHVYLIEGDPGTGKTTSGLQFLMEGARNGEAGSTSPSLNLSMS